MIHELPELRNRTHVFRDRHHAGEVLARMLEGMRLAGVRILAIPAGGVPVAAAMAQALGFPLDVAVVSKVTPSWNSEVGYGAVAFDGRVRLDGWKRAGLGVDEREVQQGIDRTVAKVRRRVESLRQGLGPLVVPGDTVVLVDDGLASGLTMATAVEALRDAGAARIIVAVPTGAGSSVKRLAGLADEVCCANVRTGWSFAVADAYETWSDVGDETLLQIMGRHRTSSSR